jgi:hypothetical protein
MDDSLDPISLPEGKHGPAHIPAAKHVSELIFPKKRQPYGLGLRHQWFDRDFEHPPSGRYRPCADGHEYSASLGEQFRNPKQGMASLVLVEMHPHRGHQDEIESRAAGMDPRQIRQGIVDPDDIRIGMEALRMGPQFGCGLGGMNLKAASRQSRGIATGPSANIEGHAWIRQ